MKPGKIKTASRKRSIGLGLFLFFIILITSVLWYWNTHKKAIIKNKLEKVVREKSNGLYKIKYDSLRMDEIAGYLSISNMDLFYDSTRYMDLIQQGDDPSILLNIHIPQISVSGVKTPRALIKNEIAGRKLEIKDPVISIIYTNSGKDSSRTIPSKEIYEQILGNLNLIQADTVLITNAQISTGNLKTKETNTQIKNVSIVLIDVKVDSTSNADTTRMFFAKKVSITCDKAAWSSADKLYDYSADSISINSVSCHARIKSIRVIPTLNEEAFEKKLKTQDDRFDLSINDVQMQNVDLPKLMEENLVADSILIGAATFKIYRDLIIPRDKKNRIGAYPQQVMQKIPLKFKVGKLLLSNGFIEYKERNQISRQSGKIQYYHVNGSISNLTNDKKAIAVNNLMTADMTTMFLNKTPLKVYGSFYLLHPEGRFELKGTLGAMDGTFLNPIIQYTGLTRIIKGKINGAEFNLQGTDYAIDGRVKLLYQDLKIAVLEKDKGSTQLDKKTISSFAINVVIKNSNPKKNDDVRLAQVHLDRNPNSAFFNFAWKALFKGIKESVGIEQ